MVSAAQEVPVIHLKHHRKELTEKPTEDKNLSVFFPLCYSLGADAIVVDLKIPRHLTLDTTHN